MLNVHISLKVNLLAKFVNLSLKIPQKRRRNGQFISGILSCCWADVVSRRLPSTRTTQRRVWFVCAPYQFWVCTRWGLPRCTLPHSRVSSYLTISTLPVRPDTSGAKQLFFCINKQVALFRKKFCA